MAEAIISNLSSLNPFGKSTKSKKPIDSDDIGESLGPDAIAGGGHSARPTTVTKSQLRISQALRQFLVTQSIISSEDADPNHDNASSALPRFLDLPHIEVPPALTDRSHPLPSYFISSSHNTYLQAHQLIGSSSADAYRTALGTGSRCVEIDAWDNNDDPQEPKVTHGYTLVSRVSFRSVCEVIRDVYDTEAREAVDAQGYRAAPILISLENHCAEQGQLRLVQIMHEVFGERLLSEAVRQEGHDEQAGGAHVTLQELGSKIVVIVEHHLPNEAADSDSSSSDSSDDEEAKEYKKQAKTAPSTIIIPELANLGVYAQSVKPTNNSWFEELSIRDGPHHHLINVSESGLSAHLPQHGPKIATHNAQHLMRVFPKGTRISSKNLNPVPFWGVGAQICALNWQTFGAGMQVNEALFSGSDGFILKPAALRQGGNGDLNSSGRARKLRLHIAGATDVPITKDHDEGEIKPYVTCSLLHPSIAQPIKKKTSPYKQHKLTGYLSKLKGDLNPPVTEPIWDEVLEWEYEENELVFLRILVKSDDSFKANPILAVATVRLEYVVNGQWRFIRLLDLHGRETTCSVLVKFDVEG